MALKLLHFSFFSQISWERKKSLNDIFKICFSNVEIRAKENYFDAKKILFDKFKQFPEIIVQGRNPIKCM